MTKSLSLLIFSVALFAHLYTWARDEPKPSISIVQEYFSCLINNDIVGLEALLSDDIIWHQPGHNKLSKTYRGKSAVFALFQEFMTISQGTFKIDSVSAIMENGDWVTATLRFSATKSDGLTKTISMSGVDLFRIENEKIAEVRLFSEDQAVEDQFWGYSETRARLSETCESSKDYKVSCIH